jgi:hypothetical protein
MNPILGVFNKMLVKYYTIRLNKKSDVLTNDLLYSASTLISATWK